MTASLTVSDRTPSRSMICRAKAPRVGSIGKVVSNLCEPDQIAGGVFRLDGDLTPVPARAVVMLALDLARRSHDFADFDRLGEFRVDEPKGSTILSDHTPCTGHDRRERRHSHHSMAYRLGNAEHFCARGPFLVGMHGIHVNRGQPLVVHRGLSPALPHARPRATPFHL